MENIEKVKYLIKQWKADYDEAKEYSLPKTMNNIKYRIAGLESALRILDEPSNTQMQIDTKPCAFCTPDLCSSIDKFCSQCGRALSD